MTYATLVRRGWLWMLVASAFGCEAGSAPDGRAPVDSGTDEPPLDAGDASATDGAAPGHRDGWTLVESGTDEPLRGVWGAAANDVWAVGENGTILHFDGERWSPQDSGTTASLHDVWGSGADDVWAVGGVWDGDLGTGTILHFDGRAWSVELDDAPQPLVAIWGSAQDHVIAVGGADSAVQLLRFDGDAWQEMEAPPPGQSSLESSWTGSDVWGTGPDDVYLTTFNSVERHHDGSWEPLVYGLASSRPPETVWGSSSSDVYVGHLIGGIRHWDGERFTDVLELTSEGEGHVNVHDLWGSGPADVFGVGGHWGRTDTVPSRGFADGAVAVHFDGERWTQHDVRELADGLYAVWGSAGSDVWAVGEHGVILRREPRAD